MNPDLVLLGNLLVDDVVLPDGRTRLGAAGGAVLHAALAARLWEVRTGIVSWAGDDYPRATLDELAARGVDLAGVQALGQPGGRAWLLYEGRHRRLLHHLERPSHAEVSPGPAQVPSAWHKARAYHLAPMPFESQKALATNLARCDGALVSLDPHHPLSADSLPAWRELLEHVDCLFLGQDEMQLLAPDEPPRARLEDLAQGRLRWVVFKRGSRGGLLYDARERRFHEWPAPGPQAVDPTGAGDAFAAGFLAGWLASRDVVTALQQAVVSASFAVADWGADGLLAGSPDAARERRRAWFDG